MYAFQLSSYDENNFHKKLPNFESGTSLNPQNSQKIFTSDFMLPDRKIVFDVLALLAQRLFYASVNMWHMDH